MNAVHAGACVCGAVRYLAHGEPLFATVCHCRFCQRRLASAFAVMASFPEASLEVTQGQLQECEHRSDESGRWLRMNFCPRCGTTIYHAAEVRPGILTIAAGTFDDTQWFSITRHIWVRSKLPWVSIPPGVPSFDRGVPQAPPPAGAGQ